MMVMQWHELLCMQRPVPPAAMRSLIPPALALETFDGTAWLGITPFRMADPLQLRLPPHASLLHFARRLAVVAWTLEAVEAQR
jgi:uncharacterized protein YqjF (DUF2071 family)